MAIGGCEVSYCFLSRRERKRDMEDKNNSLETTSPIPDLTDMEEVRKAIIANEILNKKY